MDTRQANKLTSHVAADNISMDSLSFSDLVCVQDQQPKFPSSNHAKRYQVSKHSSEFEFTTTKPNLNSAVNRIKITSADQLISNGQLQPQALPFQTTQCVIINRPSSLSPLQATHISGKMPSGQTITATKYHEKLSKSSKHTTTNKQTTVARTGFRQKMKSFLSPCRECQTIKHDAVKAQTVPGEKIKIY
ncbi:uncharacterized protein LOC130723833 [Lotus japonicus]|uniref:uncharacterized protein LOC130723833 n=1 Tax=Lotus japonicus TaxID=34305 RepID=UPI0025881921|nr:uncharacterized protein LOC130723833 [Lotus japonicus]